MLAAMTLFSCDLANGNNDGPDDKDKIETGSYAPVANAANVNVTVATPSKKFNDDFTYAEFAQAVKDAYANGTMDKMSLNENKTWSLGMDATALIPMSTPPTKAGSFIDIPGNYGVDASLFTWSYSLDIVMLSMPREAGEQILKDLLPANFDFLFEETAALEQFNTGIFRVTSSAISLNFKYRFENGNTFVYVDAAMLSATLGKIKTVLDLIENPSNTLTEINEYITSYLEFLEDSETFEVGIWFKLG